MIIFLCSKIDVLEEEINWSTGGQLNPHLAQYANGQQGVTDWEEMKGDIK